MEQVAEITFRTAQAEAQITIQQDCFIPRVGDEVLFTSGLYIVQRVVWVHARTAIEINQRQRVDVWILKTHEYSSYNKA